MHSFLLYPYSGSLLIERCCSERREDVKPSLFAQSRKLQTVPSLIFLAIGGEGDLQLLIDEQLVDSFGLLLNLQRNPVNLR
jgi:hypothetical protein